MIATDQMILIYLYIVTRAKIVDMFAHLKYITTFTTPYVRQSNLGFLLATYEHALYTLMEHDKDELRQSNTLTKTRVIDLSVTSRQPVRESFADLSMSRGTYVPDALYNSTNDEFAEMSEDNISYMLDR